MPEHVSLSIRSLAWRFQRPNDPKLSDCPARRDGCAGEGGGAAGVTRGAVRSSAWLGDVLIGVWFSGPCLSDCATMSTPSRRQISDGRQGRIKLECCAHADDSAIFRCIGSAADESPRVVVGVVNCGKNGKTVLNDLSCCDGGDIRCLVKRPFGHRCAESPNESSSAAALGRKGQP